MVLHAAGVRQKALGSSAQPEKNTCPLTAEMHVTRQLVDFQLHVTFPGPGSTETGAKLLC